MSGVSSEGVVMRGVGWRGAGWTGVVGQGLQQEQGCRRVSEGMEGHGVTTASLASHPIPCAPVPSEGCPGPPHLQTWCCLEAPGLR